MKNSSTNGITKNVNAPTYQYPYRQIGVGTAHPVIVLNQPTDMPENRNRPFIARLAESHRVIIFDNRAVLGSNCYSPIDVLDTARYAINFIETFALGPVDLVEFFNDVLAAQQIVRERPDLIRRVILVDTVSNGFEKIRNLSALSDDTASPGGVGGIGRCSRETRADPALAR